MASSLQIWNLGSPDPNFTLDAHQKGVNCVDYFTGGDKPYLITGSDDHTAKVFIGYEFLKCRCFNGHMLCGIANECNLINTGMGLPNEELCSDT